jgi:hypothetical protein
MLAALLPLLEALGAEGAAGGTAAGLGGGVAAEGGVGSLLGRILGGGGGQAFGSQAEMGGALRKISDLQATIQSAQQEMEQKRQRQEQIAQQARENERKYAFSDPAHGQQMADLVRQQQEHLAEMKRAQRERDALQSRVAMTNDPGSGRMASMSQMLGVVGAIGAVSSLQRQKPEDPIRAMDFANPMNLIRKLWNRGTNAAGAAGQAGANAGSFVAGPTNSGIIGDAAGTGRQMLGDLMHPTRLVRDISELPQKIKNWGEALVESQRGISRFNGTLALTFAEQERRGVIRAIQSGGRTGGATSELSGKLQDLYDQIQPMKDTVTVVVARGLTVAVDYLSKILKSVEAMVPAMREIERRFLGMSKEQFKEFLESFERLQRQMEAEECRRSDRARAFEDALARDKKKRLGVPKR